MKYNQPFGITDPEAGYINGDPSQGIPGSIPPAASIEYDQREIVNAISLSGLVPTNTDLTQLWQAMQRERGSRYGVDTSATPNIILVDLTPPLTSYVEGFTILVKIAQDNTGATTINVNSLGAKNVTRPNLNPLSAGAIVQNSVAFMVYDGTQFQLIATLDASALETSQWHFGHDSGSVNALIVADLTPAITAYTAGDVLAISPSQTTTSTTVTINVGGLGAKNIKRGPSSNLAVNDILVGIIAVLVYDGTQFQLVNPQVGAAGVVNNVVTMDEALLLYYGCF